MPRRNRDGGRHHTTKQKGRSLVGHGVGTYARKKKAKNADRYDRPYLEGTYKKATP